MTNFISLIHYKCTYGLTLGHSNCRVIMCNEQSSSHGREECEGGKCNEASIYTKPATTNKI